MAAPVQPQQSPYQRRAQNPANPAAPTGDQYGQRRYAPIQGQGTPAANGNPVNAAQGAPPKPEVQPYLGQTANATAPATAMGQPTGAPAAPAPAPAPAAPAAAPAASSLTPAQQAQQAALGSLSSAQNAPDRVALANTTFQNLVSSGDPAYQQSIRDAAANAARYGRIGAGQTTNELDDLALARQRTLDTTASQLATDAAGQTLSDRLAVANAGLGQYSAYQGADQAAKNESDTAAYQTGSLKNTADANANTLQLGLGANANTATANANTAAYQQGTLGIDQGRLGLDTTTAANQDKIAQATLALNTTLGNGQLALGDRNADTSALSAQGQIDQAKAALAQQGSQFNQNFGQTQLEDDRNFTLDDRTAQALASLSGTDLTNSGTDANGNPINATNLGTVTTNGTASTTPAAANPGGQVLADNDPTVSSAVQQYKKWEATIAANGYGSPQGQMALTQEQQARQAIAAYLNQNNAQLSPAQRQALGIQDNTPGFEQASTTAKFAPVTG